MLVLAGGTVVDGDGERTADVVVEDDTITAVGFDHGAGDVATIDAEGLFVAPGLVDAHVHLALDGRADTTSLTAEAETMLAYRAADHLRGAVRAGVTTVRDLGGPPTLAVDARDAVAEGVLLGPRVVPAGANITMTGGHGHHIGGCEVDGTAEARKAARRQLKHGAEALKCMATGGVLTEGAQTGASELTESEMRAVVEVGEAANVPVAAHAHGREGIENAVRAGVDSVEHGTFMDRGTAELMADRGVFWVPTTKALVGINEGGVEGGIPDWAVAKSRDATDDHRESFDIALDEDVPIAMGTDAGTPFNYHADAAEELELMVERGLSPERALEAATADAADLLGLDDVGLVFENYRADLVVLPENPLEDATAWQRPQAVVAGGEVVRDET
ncbi:MAG: amidohydrolase family protein [Haloarculaceae archaeon]